MIYVNNSSLIKDISNVVNDGTPTFSGIVSGECKGDLWVNDLEAPSIAIARSYAAGSFAFLGKHLENRDAQSLKNYIEQDIFKLQKYKGENFFEFSVESEYIKESILNLFQDKTLQSETEFSFRLEERQENELDIWKNNYQISDEYKVRKIDDALWNMILAGKFTNEKMLTVRLLESWQSFEVFKNKSIGYCITKGWEIVAVMVGTGRYKNVLAIDIETHKQHQRKGLAFAMAKEFIADCFNNNIVPQWDCIESNINSYNLANKLGFTKINENTVYWFGI